MQAYPRRGLLLFLCNPQRRSRDLNRGEARTIFNSKSSPRYQEIPVNQDDPPHVALQHESHHPFPLSDRGRINPKWLNPSNKRRKRASDGAERGVTRRERSTAALFSCHLAYFLRYLLVLCVRVVERKQEAREEQRGK